MGMKRLREEDQDETVATANCLMLLSKVGEETEKGSATYVKDHRRSSDRVFECKTCKKKFQSFQALGGHRASHKKLRLMAADLLQRALSPAKPKTHACAICGLDFPMGQALGGHMRRHRQFVRAEEEIKSASSVAVADYKTDDVKSFPILTRSASCKRIFGFDGLDLNLTPDENDLKLRNTSNSPTTPFFHVIA